MQGTRFEVGILKSTLKYSPPVDFRQRIYRRPVLIVGSRLTVTLGVRPTKPKQGALEGSLVGFRKRNSTPLELSVTAL